MKLNRKGFTLIELLAVITILGILMIVGIPAVQRTINNSRKDTFYDTAKEYANAVKTAWAADDIKCGASETLASSSAAGTTHAVWFQTGGSFSISDEVITGQGAFATSNKDNLLQSGGKSSWGNEDVAGYVLVSVPDANAASQNLTYSVVMVDAKGHGFSTPVNVDQLGRENVESNKTLPTSASATDSCKVNAN